MGHTILRGADLESAYLLATFFGNTDLSETQGLSSCLHDGPSHLDSRTLARSGPLPLAFLRGCGLSDWEIEVAKLYQPGLPDQKKIDITYRIAELTTGDVIQYHSCFISYSHFDEDFARRLHADLQNHGVRCWFAPDDLKIGDRFQDTIDRAIRLRDKLLVILSENALASEWVEDEIQAALEEERRGGEQRTVLFPLRIDDAIDTADVAWATRIRRTRHIGDFSRWTEHEAYQAAFARLLRDLKAEGEA